MRKMRTIRDVADVFDGPHATPSKTETGPIFLGISALNRGRLDMFQAEHLSEEDYLRWTRRVTPQPDDVVFSYETRLGEAAIIPSGLKCCLGRRMALMRVREGAADPKYLLYTFLADDFQDIVRARTVQGSTVDRIALVEFPSFPISLPDLETQRRVGAILSNFDRRIDLLNATNRTLAAICRQFYRAWFVDFEPSRARIDGERPRAAGERLSHLFPKSFVQSAIGEVPTGWAVSPLSEIFDIYSGGTPRTSNPAYWNGPIPWFAVRDTPGPGDLFVTATEKSITASGLANCAAKLLPPYTTIITARGTVGNLALTSSEMVMNQSCFGLRRRGLHAPAFTFFLMEQAVIDLQQNTHGSVFDTINRSTFESVLALNPPDRVVEAYESTVAPFLQRILTNVHARRVLQGLRDGLLNPLVTGDLAPGASS